MAIAMPQTLTLQDRRCLGARRALSQGKVTGDRPGFFSARPAQALALAALCATAFPEWAKAETQNNNWTFSGAPDAGAIYGFVESDLWLILPALIIVFSRVVNIAVGQYRMHYLGDALASNSGFPTTITPTISTATPPARG